MNILQAMEDDSLFGRVFRGDSWANWKTLLAGYYGLPVPDPALWRTLTAREPPTEAAKELWLAIGRRAGKSQIAALLAVFEACFTDYQDQLSAGEVATTMVIASDRRQARVVMRYVRGLINSSEILRRLVFRDREESIELENGGIIEVQTASHRRTRGYSVACAILDEAAFWYDSGANPDKEILAALRPSMATLNGKLIALSSPHGKRGILWQAHKRYYGRSGPVLVAQSPSMTMNPLLSSDIVAQAYQEDAVAAASEYGGLFRDDLEAFISRETVEALVRSSPLELPFDSKHRYTGFVDAAGGGQDEFSLCIAHPNGDNVVIDVVRGLRGVPAHIVREYSAILKSYNVHRVTGDRYGGSWPGDEFARHGIAYQTAELSKSDLYKTALPVLNSARVELPPYDKLINQWVSLERRTARGGRDSVDHPVAGHDDLANACAGAITLCAKRQGDCRPYLTNIATL
jgi:hypothetical protein